MLSANYYSYVKVIDDDGVFYQFITKHSIGYTVYFRLYEYSKYVNNFPLLLQKGYSFGLRKQKFDDSKRNINDIKVFSTIYNIVADFFSDYGKDVILLYHCDFSDKRQAHRNKLFDLWEKNVLSENTISKYSVEVQIGHDDFYLGFISLNDNPLIEEIKSEFAEFSYFIIQPK